MKSVFIIGDVHGCFKTLKALLNKLPTNATVVFAGDLIDRGPNSKDVIELIRTNDNYFSVQGNHELDFLGFNFSVYGNHIKPRFRFSDYREDVRPTFKSYKSGDIELFHKHRKFLRELPLFLVFKFKNAKNLIVSHSIILPKWKGSDESLYDYNDRTFIQYGHIINPSGEIKYKDLKNDLYFNVFGHTPFEEPVITDSWAAIDTGAVFKGKLTALQYPEMNIISQENIEES